MALKSEATELVRELAAEKVPQKTSNDTERFITICPSALWAWKRQLKLQCYRRDISRRAREA